METWATFSIVDHRQPVYRQALALFDKIIVPIPPEPLGDQTKEELLQLETEIEYLTRKDAAQPYEWSSDAFQEWRTPFLAEAAAAGLNRDVFHDTRLMLVDKLATDEVQAVPVYAGMEQYDRSRQELMPVEQALTLEILQRLPVPDYDTPLENLIRLRSDPAFRTALTDLLDWKRLRLPAIVMDADRPKAIAAAMRDFDTMTRRYADAMEAAGYNRAGQVASIFFSIATGEIIGAIKEGLVSAREVKEPCWKQVSEMKCAPGGVVYHFTRALQ
jgi:hypothetical protein